MSDLVIPPITIMNQTVASTGTSTSVHILYCDNVGIQLIWTGAVTATIGINISNNATLGPNGTISGGTWSALTGSYPAPAGSTGSGFISLVDVCSAFIQLVYTTGSGTGNIKAILVGKST